MTLIECHECAGRVSTEAQSCPHCGAPVPSEAQADIVNSSAQKNSFGNTDDKTQAHQTDEAVCEGTTRVQWYYTQGDEERGPVSYIGLKALAEQGKLRPSDLLWREGMEAWEPANKVGEGLFRQGVKTDDPHAKSYAVNFRPYLWPYIKGWVSLEGLFFCDRPRRYSRRSGHRVAGTLDSRRTPCSARRV